jgi:DNA helicase-2/ATP-dependent DNA helicase PcrA
MANELENNIFLVNAPAGSGKTTWIRKKVEGHLLQFPDDNILCITYTNRAAEELSHDLDSNRVFFGTIHKFINDFIGSFFAHKDIIDLYWEIYREEISKRIENQEQKENIAEGNARYIEKYGSLDVDTVYRNIDKISYNEAPFNSLYRGALGHDDLISFTRIAVERFPVIRKKIAEKYQLIFIDEYQDTAAAVLEIFFSSMSGKSGKMYLLGDKMQQIYKNYDGSFENEFKRMDRTINLDTNYRTTPTIVAILNAIYNDNEFTQKPYEKNLDTDMKFYPRIVFTDDIEKTLSDFVSENEDALVLFLSNKERFYGIGAGNLFDAVNAMDKYKFGKKYTVVDVLTKEEVQNEDILFKMIFLLCDIFQNYESKQYGEVFRCVRNNTKIFNAGKYLVKQHSHKGQIKEKLDKLICSYNSSNITIGGLIEECSGLELLVKEYYEEIVGDADYQIVLDVKMDEVRRLIDYLRNPRISTQHGVKGESHDTVVFVAENSTTTPIVHMNKFFEIWSSMDIRLADFDAFYYGYLKMIQNVQSICGVKQSALNKDIYEKAEEQIIGIIKEYAELNKENEYYSCLLKTHIDKYFGKPNMTNLKPCIRESTVYGALSAYRLFYVGCSRARRNLEIIIKNEDVLAFKDRLSSKCVRCGFEIVQE